MLVFSTVRMVEGTTQPQMPRATLLGGKAVTEAGESPSRCTEATSTLFKCLHYLVFTDTAKPYFAIFGIEKC
jgi:hypothetical protein